MDRFPSSPCLRSSQWQQRRTHPGYHHVGRVACTSPYSEGLGALRQSNCFTLCRHRGTLFAGKPLVLAQGLRRTICTTRLGCTFLSIYGKLPTMLSLVYTSSLLRLQVLCLRDESSPWNAPELIEPRLHSQSGWMSMLSRSSDHRPWASRHL